MDTTMFAQFRQTIAAAFEAEILRDPTLDGRLTLARDGRIEIVYAPFEHLVPTAQVVIVGITPGAQQAGNALAEARRRVLAGDDDVASLAAAKVHGSFSGAMRDGLVRMLDHVGLNQRLGIPTCARLWDSHAHLAHFTSALRYPVFLDGKNYNGNPSMTRTPLLRAMIEDHLAAEARTLPEALWIPCGGTAAEGVEWLVRQGVLDPDRVCLGMPHPSPANAERVRYFLGIGRQRSALSNKTNPDLIDRARTEMIAKVQGLPVAAAAARIKIDPAPFRAAGVSIERAERRPDPEFARKPVASPDRLVAEVHDAIRTDGRFQEHREPTQKLATYRALPSGVVFGALMDGVNAVILWLPASDAVKGAVASEGIVVPLVSKPYANPTKPGAYGRHSNLKAVPELRDAALLAVPVMSAGQAIRILAALT